ncbi:MAG: HypC/HybG/HupF family hydrogenase formation chaperone [Mycobacteriales bacterium]|nr:MAG: HypC/HybG/HupF family hydrogenase formation chaperone [Pseudonocardiales bacterium]
MCLGIPGTVVDVEAGCDTARVDVAGLVRDINIALLEPRVEPGEHILIHSGFALERMTADEARDALEVFIDGAEPSTGGSS